MGYTVYHPMMASFFFFFRDKTMINQWNLPDHKAAIVDDYRVGIVNVISGYVLWLNCISYVFISLLKTVVLFQYNYPVSLHIISTILACPARGCPIPLGSLKLGCESKHSHLPQHPSLVYYIHQTCVRTTYSAESYR